MPIAMKMKGVARVDLTLCGPGPDGSSRAYYRIADIYLDSAAQMQQTLASPEAQAAVADLANSATGGVTTIAGSVESIAMTA